MPSPAARPTTVLVTGGNRGIGYALTELLADRGYRVVFTARNADRGEAALARLRRSAARRVELRICDLSDRDSIAGCAGALVEAGDPLVGVVHNAGVLHAPDVRTLTAEGLEVTLATNAVGPWRLTRALRPVLEIAPACRVLGLTSRLHQPGSRGTPVDFRFEDPNLEHGYDRGRAYKNSKLALIWVCRELDRQLPASVTVDAICPGFVPATAAGYTSGAQRWLLRRVLPRFRFTRSLPESAADVAWALDAPEVAGTGGRYLADRAVAEPSADARDDALARRFADWLTALDS